jgi:hypothetical protein
MQARGSRVVQRMGVQTNERARGRMARPGTNHEECGRPAEKGRHPRWWGHAVSG